MRRNNLNAFFFLKESSILRIVYILDFTETNLYDQIKVQIKNVKYNMQ